MVDINERDFRGLDLNLLLVFSALLRERNVTRAADRLFIGQPAVSGALKRLRGALGDELFVRTSHGMTPTQRALELAAAVGPLLATLQHALSTRPAFDPQASERVFRIGTSDSLEIALMPALMRRLAERAPKVRLVTRAANSQQASAQLDAGEVELAVGALPPSPAWQRRRHLFDWSFVCLFDRERVRTRGKRISLAEYLRHPHVITSFDGGLRGFIDDRLEERGLARRVVFSSPHFATSPLIALQMPVITTVPTFIAETWREVIGLAMSPLPIETPTHQVAAAWAAANDGDAGLRWLVDELAAVTKREPLRPQGSR